MNNLQFLIGLRKKMVMVTAAAKMNKKKYKNWEGKMTTVPMLVPVL